MIGSLFDIKKGHQKSEIVNFVEANANNQYEDLTLLRYYEIWIFLFKFLYITCPFFYYVVFDLSFRISISEFSCLIILAPIFFKLYINLNFLLIGINRLMLTKKQKMLVQLGEKAPIQAKTLSTIIETIRLNPVYVLINYKCFKYSFSLLTNA